MKAIFLVAGNGIRMRPLTLKTPKSLLEVAGKPLLYHIVSKLPDAVDEIILVVGHLGNQIKNYCKDRFLGRKVSYVEQENQRGTYHAVSLCYPLIHNGKDKRFFVFYGDDLIDAETISNMMKHKRAVLVHEVPDPRRFGVVVSNSDGRVLEIIEKPEEPPANTVLANGLLLDDKIFQYPPLQVVKGEYYLSTAVAEMAKHNKVMAVKANFWFPIATPEDIKKAEEILDSKS